MLHDLLTHGFNGNVWIWFHGLAGGVMAIIGIRWRMTPGRILLWVLVIALSWEVWEVVWAYTGQHTTIPAIYGAWAHWAYDSAGDVMITGAIAGMVVYGRR